MMIEDGAGLLMHLQDVGMLNGTESNRCDATIRRFVGDIVSQGLLERTVRGSRYGIVHTVNAGKRSYRLLAAHANSFDKTVYLFLSYLSRDNMLLFVSTPGRSTQHSGTDAAIWGIRVMSSRSGFHSCWLKPTDIFSLFGQNVLNLPVKEAFTDSIRLKFAYFYVNLREIASGISLASGVFRNACDALSSNFMQHGNKNFIGNKNQGGETMKRSSHVSISLATTGLLFALAGCAEQPVNDITAAEQALQLAREAGANQYAANEFREAEEALQKAQEEIQLQGKKFALLRNYDNATNLLAQAKTTAEKAKTEAEANRIKAKSEAEAAIATAKTSLEQATMILAQAPSGKGTQADLQALRSDLQAAEAMFNELESGMQQEDYLGVKAKAQSVQDMASKVHDQVSQAMSKVGKGKVKA